jgi:hypothetical protein
MTVDQPRGDPGQAGRRCRGPARLTLGQPGDRGPAGCARAHRARRARRSHPRRQRRTFNLRMQNEEHARGRCGRTGMLPGGCQASLFSLYFKWLTHKRAALATRVATLSQHLFYEPHRHRFWNRRRVFANEFHEIAKAAVGVLIPKCRHLVTRSTSTTAVSFAQIGALAGGLGERVISSPLLPFPADQRHDRTFPGEASNPSARRGARYSPRTSLRQVSTAIAKIR